MKLNANYSLLKENYLFAETASRIEKFIALNPDKKVIKMGIGDVTLPIVAPVVEAMKKAADEMGVKESFRGYGPYQGYDFLIDAIRNYYAEIGVLIKSNEVFVSEGAKSDSANITDIFSDDNVICISDPVYPVYLDSNLMLNRKIIFARGGRDFKAMPDSLSGRADIIYLCSPNNPTGAVYTKGELKKWINYAISNNAIILYDAAYEAYIKDPALPRSIFELEGARKCAIELCSFSKTAGFTGVRCSYTVIPDELNYDGVSVNKMWLRRQTTKFNGVAYVIQRGAEAAFSPEGLVEVRKNIDYYMTNALALSKFFDTKGIYHTGGKNSPYIWLECPDKMNSWQFFDYLLEKAYVAGTPGEGFGKAGEGYFRLTAFNTYENTLESIDRMDKIL
ncbi:MAG: LL-diaminopimelate aminotransferase [Christensenellales bacterium]